MRKIVVSMNISLDGFIAGWDGGLDWHFEYWNDEMMEYAGRRLSDADTILLGRVTFNAMSGHWPLVTQNLYGSREDIAFAEMMNNYTKVVFSHTLKKAGWNNSILVCRNFREELLRLKHNNGKDIITYGSRKLVMWMMEMGLVDSYTLWVHPVTLGNGQSLFSRTNAVRSLRLQSVKTFSCGVVALDYSMV